MANTETGWIAGIPKRAGWYFMRLADEDVNDGDIVVWVDDNPSGVRSGKQFFPADNKILRCREYLGPVTPSDAEQLSELRRLAIEARDVLALLVPYGKIHTVNGVTYPDGTHSEAVDRGERVLNQLRAALNPSQSQEEKETR